MVNILGYEFLKSSSIQDIRKEVISLRDQLLSNRPGLDQLQRMGVGGVRIPYWPKPMADLYDAALYSDVIRNVINSLKTELFRNGWEFEEVWTSKCGECGEEYDFETEVCQECGSSNIANPDRTQIDELEQMFKNKVNINGQTLLEILEQIEDDLNIVDDGYILIIKDYFYNDDGLIIGGKVKELLRGNPMIIRLIRDKQGRPGRDDLGEEVLVCPEHRTRRVHSRTCSVCGKMTMKAVAVAIEQQEVQGNELYYIEDEVIHVSKYSPSLIYGFPPMLTVWQKVIALMEMDKFILEYYQERKMPRGILLVATRAVESLQKAWDWLLERMKKNPHEVAPLAVEVPEKSGGKFTEFINFMNTLQEMQYIEARNEMRRTIGAVFGVMPMFQADISASGGLNNEGLQVTVTNRAVAKGQGIYNDKIFPKLLKVFGVTDFVLKLLPSEEVDEMAELQREGVKITNAQGMKNLGFKISMDEEGELKFEEPEEGIPVQEPMQGFGGFSSTSGSRMTGITPPAKPAGAAPKQPRFEGEPRTVRRALRSVAKDIRKQKFSLKDIERMEPKLKFIAQELYKKKFENLTKGESDIIKALILNSIEKKTSVDILVRKIMEVFRGKVAEEDLERIVRTEHQAVTNKLREFAYVESDPQKENRYKWIGPSDYRTTDICHAIKARTINGVTLAELKKIIHEEGKRGGFEPRDFTPHISCRHTFIKVV